MVGDAGVVAEEALSVSSRDPDISRSIQGLTVVVPAYNEAKAIGSVLEGLTAVLGRISEPSEILVVDDGSDDETATLAKSQPNVRVLRHRVNRGYGAALKTGIRRASYDVVCIIDADSSYPHSVIPDLLACLVQDRLDMVVGARVGEDVEVPLSRRPAKWVIRQLAGFITGQSIPDLNSGLRIFRRDVALRMFSLLPDRFSFTTTITLAMLTNGYLVRFMPINYYPRVGRSKIRPVEDTLHFVELVWRIALYFAPLKVFLPTSGVLLALAGAWAVFSKVVLGQLADVSTLVIAMTGFQIAIIGMLAELVNRRLPNYFKD